MAVIQKALTLENEEFYRQHLTIINTLLSLDLTEKEIEVLGAFMSLDKSLIKEDMFNTLTRKMVRERKGLSPGGLGNYLKSFVIKKIATKNELTRKITIKPYLHPDEVMQGYRIKLVKK